MVIGLLYCHIAVISPHVTILQVFGALLIVAGIVIQSAYSQYLDFLGHYFSTPVFLILLGFIIFVVSFFGCCGAINKSHCMTLTFAWMLGTIFLLEVGTGIAVYNLRAQVMHNIINEKTK